MANLGIRLPFRTLEVEVLNLLNACPTQPMSNAWRLLRLVGDLARKLKMECTIKVFLFACVECYSEWIGANTETSW